MMWARVYIEILGVEAMMDTTKLVVGQKVYMTSGGIYGCEGTVVKVTPSGVDVQHINDGQTIDALLHFDNNGRSYVTELPPFCDPEDKRPWTRYVNGTPECGPWYISAYLVNGKMVFTEFGQAGYWQNIRH